jgi:CheY-like chemotaxis protein
MDAPTRARVFDPFFSTKEEGTGLGLATVFGILKQSGGHVAVYSEPGIGTTFRIYLRRAEGPMPAQPAATTTETLSGYETILLVEDADAVRRLVVDILEPRGYTVIAASDGLEALELARNAPLPIDLLLTDVVMPGMNGRKLAEEARRRRPALKVLFMTGYSRNAIVHQGRLDAGVELIQKPLDSEQLATTVRRILDT